MKKWGIFGVALLAAVLLACTGCDVSSGMPGQGEKDKYDASLASEGLEYTLNKEGTGYWVVSIGTATAANIVIPESYEGLPVIKIGCNAFSECEQLTSIAIPASVTEIYYNAFDFCPNIANIVVEQGNPVYHSSNNCLILTEEKRMILGCANSQIPDDGSVTSISQGAFSCCEGLTSITIPGCIPEIESSTFSNCTNLANVTISEGVTTIAASAFFNCESLTSITIPKSVTDIDGRAFSHCTSLSSITVEEGNTQYHSSQNCLISTNTKGLVLGCKDSVIPDDGSVTYIGSYAFLGCSNLTSMDIPDSVTRIEERAFGDCSGLTSVRFSNRMSGIPPYAFIGCSSLTSIYIPDSITNIAKNAFWNCGGLTSIIVDPENPVYHSVNHCLIETDSKTLVRGCANSEIPADGQVTSIGVEAFSGCMDLVSMTIPDGVTSIAERVFQNCSGLTSVTIPDSVTSMGEVLFQGCGSLMNITVGEGNAVYHSFQNCLIETDSQTLIRGCASSEIPTDGRVTSIGKYAFDNCVDLTSITIPSSVVSIGEYAFFECGNLTSITYQGTTEEWNAMNKEWYWNGTISPFTIHCTDGDIILE